MPFHVPPSDDEVWFLVTGFFFMLLQEPMLGDAYQFFFGV